MLSFILIHQYGQLSEIKQILIKRDKVRYQHIKG